MAANDDLLDRQIRHQIYVQRYSSQVVNKMVKLLGESESDLRKQLQVRYLKLISRGYDTGPVTTRRFEKMIKALVAIQKLSYGKFRNELIKEIRDFAAYEAGFQGGVLQSSIGGSIVVTTPAPETVRAAAMARPFQGRLLKDWVRDLAGNNYSELRRQIQIGFTEGESVQQMTRRVKSLLNTSKRHVDSIVRTAVNHTANAARAEVEKANSDLIKGVKIIATLDTRTSPICRDRDNKVYEVDKGPRPPFHINCRTTFVWITKSWRELGINKDELEADTRASMSGQVPADMSYWTWLKYQSKQNPGVLDDVLGPKRSKLFRDGGIKLDRFSNDGKMHTLEELRKKDPIAFKKAGV